MKGVWYGSLMLVGSLFLPGELGASAAFLSRNSITALNSTLFCFLLCLAMLHQSQQILAHSEAGFQLLSSQKDTFIRTVSHEIRTPLQGLISGAEMLSSVRLPENARQMVETIFHCSSTLKLLTDNVLGVGKGVVVPVCSNVEVAELAHKVQMYGTALALSKVGWSVRIVNHVNPRALVLPETQLLQILLNFISNSIKVNGFFLIFPQSFSKSACCSFLRRIAGSSRSPWRCRTPRRWCALCKMTAAACEAAFAESCFSL